MLTGGTGNDSVTLVTPLSTAMTLDLAAGANKLVLAGTGGTGTASNVGTLVGGAGGDVVTLATTLIAGSVDLGAGADILVLANGANVATLGNVESLIGGSGAEHTPHSQPEPPAPASISAVAPTHSPSAHPVRMHPLPISRRSSAASATTLSLSPPP